MNRGMTALALFMAGAMFLAPASRVQGHGLLYHLPRDGTWARYSVKTFLTDRTKKGASQTFLGNVFISSVGQEVVDGEPCRWIEIRVEMDHAKGVKQETLFKGLIAEEHLGKGKNPVGKWKKIYGRVGMEKARLLTMEEVKSPLTRINLFVGPPLQDRMPLKEKEMKTGLGDLAAKGESGLLLLKNGFVAIKDGMVTKKDMVLQIESYLHEKSPFGPIFIQIRTQKGAAAAGFPSMEEELTLQEVGADAKSHLPDLK